MRVEHNEDGTTDVWVRQSWLNDAVMCNERGRYGIVLPEWSHVANELTAMGTAVHAGIAAVLRGESQSVKQSAITEWERLLTEPMRIVRHTHAECVDFIRNMSDAWERDLRSMVRGELLGVEQSFEFLLDEYMMADTLVRVWGKGTIDVVTTEVVIDHKTSGRKYNQRDKQRTAIQPSMYSAAVVAAGTHEYPVEFDYGLMIRGGGTQRVPLVRTAAHESWIRAVTRPLVRQALLVGLHETWSLNDTHYLCSEAWCSWWSICRGAVISPADDVPVALRGLTAA